MAINFTLPLRIAQIILAIIILGLTAYGTSPFPPPETTPTNTSTVAHWWGGYWHQASASEINFLVFASVWSLLALIFLLAAPTAFPAAAHKFAILGADALTMLFWFAGFIAAAVFLTDRVCAGRVCDTLKAATVFAAFEW